ncbi:glycerate kinase [Lichenibacterium minor]|uniref:Glycerate kinase n=1 Tax=Lichenibacterium minor TaxID=2316528 RepID=A0A4Q2UF19_9HYPH|nr:glycerate kinase [Lichenibacterium minor]RYC33911.1 glycerate kinase [Lichenibacterium minor]
MIEDDGGARVFLSELFRAAVAAAHPAVAVPRHLPPRPRGRTIVVGAGKASAQMARALEGAWDGPLSGAIVTRYGCGCPCDRIEVLEAAHPVPDAAGLAATRRMVELVAAAGPNDLVIALVSGGGSALLPAPPPGLDLGDEMALNEALLRSGAPIGAMNAVRKHASAIKGGRLAAASRAPVASLILSDIPGDAPHLVASGPTVPDGATRAEALRAVADYRIDLPHRVLAHLASGAADAPLPGDPRFAGHTHVIVASAGLSLDAAAAEAARRGVAAAVLSDAIEGEARDVGLVHAALAREVAARGRPFAKPVVILSGGETTVTLRGRGRGGRNAEFLLSLALAIDGVPGVSALAADTDGIDGSETNAGAFADGGTAAAIRAAGLDPRALLMANDSYSAFAGVGALFDTGPTGTNVNDFRAILVR